jgi:hypothetical protein
MEVSKIPALIRVHSGQRNEVETENGRSILLRPCE